MESSLPRIAIVTATFPPYRGGMGNVALTQAKLLQAAGFPVIVYTPLHLESFSSSHSRWSLGKIFSWWRQNKLHGQGSVTGYTPTAPAGEQVEGVLVRRLKAVAHYGNAAWCPSIAKVTREAEVVLLHYPFFGGIESLALRRKVSGQRLVVYYHMDAIGRGFWWFIFRLHRWLFLPPLLQQADAVAVSSYEYAHSSSALRPLLQTLRGKLHEVPLSVDTVHFSPGAKPEALRRSLGMPPSDLVVLFVGVLDRAHYFKGLPILLKAWQRLTKHFPETRLVVVGEGNKRADFLEEAHRRGLAKSVVFAGAVAEADLPDYYRLADVVVLPSIDRSEAFGLVLLEAMASGRATLASRLPGVASVVRVGETGYLLPVGSSRALAAALERLLAMPSGLKAMGEKGRAVAETEYSEAKLAERLCSLVSPPR